MTEMPHTILEKQLDTAQIPKAGSYLSANSDHGAHKSFSIEQRNPAIESKTNMLHRRCKHVIYPSGPNICTTQALQLQARNQNHLLPEPPYISNNANDTDYATGDSTDACVS